MHKSRKRTAARVLGRQASIEPSLPNLETLRTISNTRSVLAVYLVPITMQVDGVLLIVLGLVKLALAALVMPSARLMVHRF
jgi:hypothetical protein